MDRVVLAIAIVVVAGIVSLIASRRRRPDAPTQAPYQSPQQLDRADFAHRESEWLLVAFTSATCHTCADVVAKAEVLASDDVAVDHAEWQTRRDVHDRYGIDGVPLLVIADRDGVVRRSFAGPVSATDLWAAVAAARADYRGDEDAQPAGRSQLATRPWALGSRGRMRSTKMRVVDRTTSA